MSKFIHLHTHSHYSLLNALPKLKELVKTAKDMGMPALALTDAGNMYGTIEFYQTCKKNEIKPIIGVDFYVAARTRNDKHGGIDNRRTRLILLAKNHNGYKNLIRLVTDSYFEGFYYKPRIDRELIEKYSKDLICIMPHFSGEISYALKNGDKEKAEDIFNWYIKVFGMDNFFLEITHHPEIEGQIALKEKIIKFAKETNASLVAGHDVYYLHPEDKAARDTLVQVNSHSDFSDREQKESADDFSFISSEKAEEYFKDIPEAIENTKKIADMCNVEIVLGKDAWVFPEFIVESGLSHDDELKRLTYLGIKRRNLTESKDVVDRIEYELKIIKDKGYSKYFLVVSDLLRFSSENGIFTNIRGSVAGSIVTYLTGITKVNPLEYKLPFERFLNPERPSAPDIDMDFADNRRDDVINYTREKYGKDNVAQIGTFGTMMARGSCRDVARAMGYPLPLADKIAKLVPMGAQGFPMTLKKAMEEVAELKQLYDSEKDAKTIIDMAQKIEGCARHISVHAAGVVIAPTPLINYVPLQYDPKGEGKIITQYDMYDVGEDGVGLLKFDFLGIKNLSILADAVHRVKKIENIDLDIESISLDDPRTFDLLSRGDTIGLFQLNGQGLTKFLKDLKPSSIHDINAMVALYRPGPLESIPEYIDRKHHPEKVKYLDPRLKDILDQSYGVITYQDDVMLTAIKLAGYSWLEADKLRKAMGKKIPAEMEAQKEKLLKGFVANGLPEKKAQTLWKLIEPFAAYGFNKCLTGDTKIIDAKNKKIFTIEEVYKNNLKPTISTMSDGFVFDKKQITMVMENGVKEVFEVKTRSGRTIKATSNHPLFAFSGWKNIGDIEKGERIAVPRNLSLLLGKKKDHMNKLVKSTNDVSLYAARGTKDIIPAEVLKTIREVMLEKNISVADISKKTKLSKRLFSFDKAKIGYQRDVINIIGKYLKSEKLVQIANSEIYWDEIISIKKMGNEMTYDITVPPYHNFIANDIVVHNSHAASYGRVAYQTAYMKANFPAIYMSSVLTADAGDVEKIGEFMTDCKKMGIAVLPPSVNESYSDFTVVKTPGASVHSKGTDRDKIRFGLTTIKNFGEGIADIIIENRKKKGKFTSLSNFLERIIDRNMNKKSLEALIKTGALDDLPAATSFKGNAAQVGFADRGVMLANIENLLKYNKEISKKNQNQDSLFGMFDNPEKSDGSTKYEAFTLDPAIPASMKDKLAWEKELLGLYISGHPLDKYRATLEKQPINIKKIKDPGQISQPETGEIKKIFNKSDGAKENKTARELVDGGQPVGGIIEEVREIMTKNNEPMAFIKIADFTGSIDAVVFPRTYAQFKNSIKVDTCIASICKVSERNGEVSLIIERLKVLE